MTPQDAAARLSATIAAVTGMFMIVEKNFYDMGGTDLVTQVLDELKRLNTENETLKRGYADSTMEAQDLRREVSAANERMIKLTAFAEWCAQSPYLYGGRTQDLKNRANEALGRASAQC